MSAITGFTQATLCLTLLQGRGSSSSTPTVKVKRMTIILTKELVMTEAAHVRAT